VKNIILFLSFLISTISFAQTTMKGKITSEGQSLQGANIVLKNTKYATITDPDGTYTIKNINLGNYEILVSYTGFKSQKKNIIVTDTTQIILDFDLKDSHILDEVVITGTLKAVSRLESPVPVEVYKPTFFKKNPTANIFEALQNVNGVRPQLNCNVCNTGDIHINGLEGPYTLVLIDGMPIVSGLSTVYGLSGIPNSLLERIEIVKGPASSLYGSEAVGGLINIITKNPKNAATFSADAFATGWGELNFDLGFKANVGKNTSLLTGVNYFNYSNPIDNNKGRAPRAAFCFCRSPSSRYLIDEMLSKVNRAYLADLAGHFRSGESLRGHADQFAFGVDRHAARVAGVDLGVGLDPAALQVEVLVEQEAGDRAVALGPA